MIDPAINALTACPGNTPETVAMTLPEICRLFYGVDEVECRYKFRLSYPASGTQDAEGTRLLRRGVGGPLNAEWIDERRIVCPHSIFEDITEMDDESTWITGPDEGEVLEGFFLGAGNPNIHAKDGNNYFPNFGNPFFTWIGNKGTDSEFYIYLTTNPNLDAFSGIEKYDGVGVGKLIIQGVDGVPVEHEFDIYSYYDDQRDDKSDTSFEPWGVLVDAMDFEFELEVVKWFAYGGAYDTDTGELLVPDAIRP
jgi:hypothetical protein